MIGILLILGLFSTHLSQIYIWNYNVSDYHLTVKDDSYNLKNPNERWVLPKELEEISGLSYYKTNQLACIQDEDGILYFFDLEKKKIVRAENFGQKGDYEGVEIISDTAYVLKSNGSVYFFSINKENIGEINEIKTDLTKKNDTEGLGFIQKRNELLIACKEEPGTKKIEIEKSRSIFQIELESKKFKKKPKYIIDGKSYNQMIDKKKLSKKKHKPFKPSGVAVHPQNNYIFIIGTVGKILVVLNPMGEIEDLIPLDPKIFRQPEGICFSPNGDLYISSEGKGKKGYILKFDKNKL